MAEIENSLGTNSGGSSGTSIHNDLFGLNDGDYIHLTELEKIKFDGIEDGAQVNPINTSELINNGSDSTSQYVEQDELSLVATSNDYNDLDNLPTIPNTTGLATETYVNDGLDLKVDKVAGKSLIDDTEISRLVSMTAIFTTTLKTAYDNAVTWITTNGTNLINHLTNFSNPHNVTATQVGAPSGSGTSTGANTGDNAVNTLYSGLATSKEDTTNKSTTTTDSASSVKFPVWSAVVSYVTSLGYISNVITALGYTPANVANKQNSLVVDGTGVKFPTVDAVNTGIGDIIYDNFIRKSLSYYLSTNNSSTFNNSLRIGNTSYSGNSVNFEKTTGITLTSSGATPSYVRGTQISTNFATDSFIEYDIKIEIRSNVSTAQGFWGLAYSFALANPTNVNPNTFVRCLGIGKLPTSDNFHIIHNDNSGTATTIDLGVNFPCNNVAGYVYHLKIKKDDASNIVVTLYRIDSLGVITTSTPYTISTDFDNTITHYAFCYFVDSAASSNLVFKHYGGVFTQK